MDSDSRQEPRIALVTGADKGLERDIQSIPARTTDAPHRPFVPK